MGYFKEVSPVRYQGPKTNATLAYRYYNAEEMILGKPMREHFRFAMCYWHTLGAQGADPFGAPTMQRPWDREHPLPMAQARQRVEVFFELLDLLGLDYFTFHDRDIAPEGETLAASNQQLDEIVTLVEGQMRQRGKKLLWGTANLFSNARFVHGAGTSCNPEVFVFAAAQIKKALEVTQRLGGRAYVFWGGREGYETLLNTDTQLELSNFAFLLKMACAYADKIGFKGTLLIEPKPKEPTKHQYDFDVATALGFLRQHQLLDRFAFNLETNHATLAGHDMPHEVRIAVDAGKLGSVDANQGDLLLGWDTDEFPFDVTQATLVLYEVLRGGGLSCGGFNFDAKVRRASFEPIDLVHAHVLGIDTYAHALRAAARLWQDGQLEELRSQRYQGYQSGIGERIRQQQLSLEECERHVLAHANEYAAVGGTNRSGRQELLQRLVQQAILGVGL